MRPLSASVKLGNIVHPSNKTKAINFFPFLLLGTQATPMNTPTAAHCAAPHATPECFRKRHSCFITGILWVQSAYFTVQ